MCPIGNEPHPLLQLANIDDEDDDNLLLLSFTDRASGRGLYVRAKVSTHPIDDSHVCQYNAT